MTYFTFTPEKEAVNIKREIRVILIRFHRISFNAKGEQKESNTTIMYVVS